MHRRSEWARAGSDRISIDDVLGQIDMCISVLSGPLTREMIGSGWNKRTRPEMLELSEQWRTRIATDGELNANQKTGVWRRLYEDSDFADSGGDVGKMIRDVDEMIRAATVSGA